MPTVSKFAKGFLSLLGIQNFGENPREVSSVIVPTVDIGAQYLLDTQVALLGGTAGNAVDGFNGTGDTTFTVPASEVWRLHAMVVSANNGVGVTISFSPAVLVQGVAVCLSDPRTVGPSLRDWNVMEASPLWLTAGMELGALVRNLTLTSPVSFQALVSKLRA